MAAKARKIYALSRERAERGWTRINADRIERNRFLVLLISLVLIFDYVMFCYHAGKNVFDIFPSFPVLDNREERTVYLPDVDGATVFKEKRKIAVPDDRETMVRKLFKIVVNGSIYENTSMAVPIDTYIRMIWFHGDTCVIDAALSTLAREAQVIPGSEAAFRAALENTITENVKTIKKVSLLERGIPDKPLWEIPAAQE